MAFKHTLRKIYSLGLGASACHAMPVRSHGSSGNQNHEVNSVPMIGTGDTVLRPASNLPARFAIRNLSAPGSPMTEATQVCAATLVDPRISAGLQLIRASQSSRTAGSHDTLVTSSYSGFGDYAVTPSGTYGVRARELLRVDCTSNRALGIVGR